PACQRHTYDHGDVARSCLAKEQHCGALPEDIVDDLNRDDVRILDGLERFLNLLDRDAVMLHFSCGNQRVERLEYFRTIVDLRRRAMQLNEIQSFDPQVLQAAIHERFEIGARIAARDMRRETTAYLGGDDRPRTIPGLQHIADDAF